MNSYLFIFINEGVFCKICDKTKNYKSRNRHNKTKRHYFTKNCVTNLYRYNDIVWGDVEKILHEKIDSHNNKLNEFKIFLLCKINDDIEIKVYNDEQDLCEVVNFFLSVDTLLCPHRW